MPWPYVAHFLLSTGVPTIVMGRNAPLSSYGLYIAGGIVWTVVGSWGVGGMHVIMTLADVALLAWTPRSRE